MLAVAAAGGSATSFAPLKLNLDLRSSSSSFPLRRRQVSRRGLRCCQVVSGSSVSALELLKKSSDGRYTKEKSSIAVIGLNVHTTPIELWEKLAMQEAQWPQAISELCALNHIEEAAVLCTCNKIEIYVVALSQHRGVKEVTEWMAKTSGVPVSELCQHRFLLYNKDATEHLFEVAAGPDSLVLGEGQIHAQLKRVVNVGQGVAGFDRKISGMFKQAITVGKRVRTETNVVRGSVSVSSAAVELAQMKAGEAQAIITEELNRFEAWRDSLETVPTIKKFSAYAERIRASEMDKCLSKTGNDSLKKNKGALYDLSMGLVNELLHGPMEHLRCDGSDDSTLSEILDNMHALDRMFELDTEMFVLEEKVRTKVGKIKNPN